MHPRETPADLERFAAALERILCLQLEAQRRVTDFIARKQDAVRRAQIKTVAAICEQEQPVVRRLGELETQRKELIGQLTAALGNAAGGPLTVSQIAAAIGDPAGARLISLAHELKQMITTAQRSSSILRVAAEALARHMAGVMQVVGSAMSGAHVYGRKGQVALGAPVQFSIDLKS